jgi:hypothetical protein
VTQRRGEAGILETADEAQFVDADDHRAVVGSAQVVDEAVVAVAAVAPRTVVTSEAEWLGSLMVRGHGPQPRDGV